MLTLGLRGKKFNCRFNQTITNYAIYGGENLYLHDRRIHRVALDNKGNMTLLEDVSSLHWDALLVIEDCYKLWKPLTLEDAVNVLGRRPATVIRMEQYTSTEEAGLLGFFMGNHILPDPQREVIHAAMPYLKLNHSVTGELFGAMTSIEPHTGFLFMDRIYFFHQCDKILDVFREDVGDYLEVWIPEAAYDTYVNDRRSDGVYVWPARQLSTPDSICRYDGDTLCIKGAKWQAIS